MNEITPDMIARVASRIYNEVNHASTVPQPPMGTAGTIPHPDVSAIPTSPGSIPSVPTTPAMPGIFNALPHTNSIPTNSIPSENFTHAAQHHPSVDPHRASHDVPFANAHASPANHHHESHNSPYSHDHGSSLHENRTSHGSPYSNDQSHGSPYSNSASSAHPLSRPQHGDNVPLGANPQFDLVPGTAGNGTSQGGSHDGLRAFVQSIRKNNYSNRDQYSGEKTGVNSYPHAGVNRATPPTGPRPMDIPSIRNDFPILRQKIHGKPLAWFDNAATTQKPQSVIDAISKFYENDNSNIHRAAHTLAARSTDAYEKARQKVQAFLGASNVKEITFVRGTTEGINLIAQTYGRKFLNPGDEVVLSMLEHHASIVPWQMIAKERGAVLRVIPVNDNGEIMLEEYQKLLSHRTKIVSLTQASNSLGTVVPVGEMTQIAKRYGARVLIDGAQSVAHTPVNMQQLGADFFVFSGHKIYGPTGIGAVYIKEELHDIIPPWQGGGNMIRNVTFEETSFSDAPAKFEAGTPNVADAVGLGAALDYVNRLGLSNIAAYEHQLLEYATEQMSRINGLKVIGTAREKVGILSFVLSNFRNEDVGKLLDQEGIAVRVGHHCSQPSLRRFGLESTIRPSFSFYNTHSEIDRMAQTVKNINRLS